MKRCSKCGTAKSSSSFKRKKQRSGNFTLASACKDCHCIDEAKRYAQETDAQRIARRGRFLLRAYGITMADYNNMFELQEGKCASCNRHQTMFLKALVVDHSHTTNKVRGLLCSGCNLALGNAGESPERLSALAGYIRKHT